MPVKPLSPSEVAEQKIVNFPDEVLTVVNELLAQNFVGGRSQVLQKDIVARLEGHFTKKEIFDKHYLDFEEVYRRAGWKVKYDKPTYGDNDFDAYFLFEKK